MWHRKKKASVVDPVLMQELLAMAKQVDPQSNIGMIDFGVRGLVLITDTVNKKINSMHQPKSRHMREIMAAYYEATVQGGKACSNLNDALTMSLSELGILRTVIAHITMQPTSNDTLGRWFKRADVKMEALQELERVDTSKLLLPTSLLTDFDDAMVAYDLVVKLCKKRRKPSFRKQAAAMTVQVACIASVIVLSFVKAGLAALEVAASILTSGIMSGTAGAGKAADELLKQLIDTLNSKIGAFHTEREVLKQAESEAGNLHIDMRKIKLTLEELKGEMFCLSSNVGVAQRLRNLSVLLERQVHEELLNHHDKLMQLKASCGELIRSTCNAFETFKQQSMIII